MYCHRRAFLITAGCVAASAATYRPAYAADPPGAVRIGVPASMFRDVKPALVAAIAKPFNTVVYNQTGLANEIVTLPTADDLRTQLEAGKIQFAVFHSHEFAWMTAKQPALQALMVASPLRRPIQFFLVVSAASPINAFADLKGKALAIPSGSRDYGRLFVERQCLALGTTPAQFFSGTVPQPEQETALHEVVDSRKVQVALVEQSGLDAFASRHPLRSKRIRVLAASPTFPPAAVAFHKGTVPDATLKRFSDGMSNAHSTELGKQLLGLWKLGGFQTVPSSYGNEIAALGKMYPQLPEEAK